MAFLQSVLQISIFRAWPSAKGVIKNFLEQFLDGPDRHEIPSETRENIPMDAQTIKLY